MRSYIIAAILLAACLPLFAADPNIPTITDEQVQQAVLSVLKANPELIKEAAQATTKTEGDTQLVVEKLAKEFYKDAADRQGAALWTLIGVVTTFVISVVAVIAYLVFTDRKGYHVALDRAENAAVRAEKMCDRTENMEQRAHAVLENLDRDADAKLKEIEDKGRAQITDLIKEAELQRKTTDLWNQALKAHTEKDYGTAIRIWNTISTDCETYRMADLQYNSGLALSALACDKSDDKKRRLYTEAIAKYNKVTQIEDDHFRTYNSWGCAQINLADLEKDDGEKRRLLIEALAKFEKTIQLQDDYTIAYSNWSRVLVRLADLEKDDDEKKAFLKKAEELKQKAKSLKQDSD